jgi:hypothetical protein
MNFVKALNEYVEVVKAAVQNGDKIVEAIRTSALVKEKEKKEKLGLPADDTTISDEAVAEIMRRKEICASCPFNSANAARDRNYSSALPFQHCTLCKCRIGGNDTKEYCLSCNCGIDTWNKRNEHLTPMELKWTAFEQPTN